LLETSKVGAKKGDPPPTGRRRGEKGRDFGEREGKAYYRKRTGKRGGKGGRSAVKKSSSKKKSTGGISRTQRGRKEKKI